MLYSLKKHWQCYLMELIGLGGFVLIAGLMTILLEHPDLPVMKSSLQDHPLLRRIPLGIVMGAYITIMILLFGKKSGAHFNPAATWSFYRLRKINFTDAVFFTIAQFIGAVVAAQFLKYAMGEFFSNPLVNYGNTEPKPPYGTMTAFIAEFIISFIMMLVVLRVISSKRLEKYAAVISGALIAIYLVIEIPFSGMSLNPARSFAGAFAANQWNYVWLYFVAPSLAMLAASEVFIAWKEKRLGYESPDDNLSKVKYMRPDYQEIPNYPVMKEV